MIPNSYKPKPPNAVEKIAELLHDQEKTLDVRFAHIDALIGQLRDDQKTGQEQIIRAVEKIVELHTANLHTIVGHQDDKINSVQGCIDEHKALDIEKLEKIHSRIDAHEARLDVLELAPGQESLYNREKITEWVKNGLVVAGVAGFLAILAALMRWDDFVKLIGGK